MRLIVFLSAVFFAIAASAQETLLGSVHDAETGEPVVGAHIIGLGKDRTGTSTNAEGNFILHGKTAPDSLRISCIGYYTVVVRHNPGVRYAVRLRTYAIPLHTLTVTPPSPRQLIAEAVKAIPTNYEYPPLQLRGFYREVIRREKAYYSVAEAIFESQLPKPGDDEALLKLIQGRRSESVTTTRIFEDYHPGGGPNYLINHLIEAQVPDFLRRTELDDYVFEIDSITSFEGRDIYVIAFDQKDDLRKNLWKGRICVDAGSKAIIDITYALSEKGITYRKHLSAADQVMAGLLGIDYTVLSRSTHYSYRADSGRWRLHQASLSMTIHFRQPRKNIDETFTLDADLLSLGQTRGPLTRFDENDVWRRNQLVKNLPGEFDEAFWGADNILQPETSLTAAVAHMNQLSAATLPLGIPNGWNLFHGSEAKAYQQGSRLLLKPYLTSRWKDQEKGPLLWQPITGDFELTARIRVTKTQDTTAAPDAGFQLGGLMIRPGNSTVENHILLGLGCMGNPQLKMISQHTINDNSAIYVSKVGTHELALRIRRQGPVVQLFHQDPAGQWKTTRTFTVAGWPEELQVGIAGYAYVTGSGPKRHPDILVHADQLELLPLSR